MRLRFTRHAKNKARRYEIDLAEVEAMIAHVEPRRLDQGGNPIYELAGLSVVVARDDPIVVITMWRR